MGCGPATDRGSGPHPVRRRAGLAATLTTIALASAACGLFDDGGPDTGSDGFRFEPNGTVVRAVDGDTLVIETGGSEERVRLIGIDTPESVRENHPIECFGPEAADRLAELAPPGTPVYLERDIEPRDQYNRLLAYVHRAEDGLHFNLEQVVQGYAEASEYPPNTALSRDLAEAERTARAEPRGLWATCDSPDTPVGPPPNG